MDSEYNYTCPNCSQECTVPESITGQNVQCPGCGMEFFATKPEAVPPPLPAAITQGQYPPFTPPAKLPFFKSGKRELLEQRMQELIIAGRGALTENGESELERNGTALGLDPKDVTEMINESFLSEFDLIKKRVEKSFTMSDEDVADIENLKLKYNVRLTMEGDAALFREIYLLETGRSRPVPIQTDLMLNDGEKAYYAVQSTWHQTRVHSHGYSGASFSIPTGIKGVRFRFGNYTPIKTEDLTPLSDGVLYITSKRVLFQGNIKNTSVNLGRIVDGQVYLDALKIEKSTGKPDYFTMIPQQARYILALISALK